MHLKDLESHFIYIMLTTLINVLDIVMIIDFILGYAEFTTHQATLADINLDGDVNVNDIVMLIESILD